MKRQNLILVGQAARRAGDGTGRIVRKQADMSIREIARLIGVQEATVSRWETGQRTPRGEAAAKWVLLLDKLEQLQRTGQ